MQDYSHIFQELGLAKNEGRIYEMLLQYGESSVGKISEKSGVHRRNVYDSLNRLIEKGLVFEILERKENTYQAVNPNKLSELLEEKAEMLSSIMPDLEKLYGSAPHDNEVHLYRGIEGWKNIFRDIIRQKSDVYIIGAKGALTSDELKPFASQFSKETKKAGIIFHILYDDSIRKTPKHIGHLGKNYKIIPEKYSNPAAIAIWKNRVIILPAAETRKRYDKNFTIILFINKQTADSFRKWFQFMWDNCPPVGNAKTKQGGDKLV